MKAAASAISLGDDRQKQDPLNLTDLQEPSSWAQELYFRQVSDEFLKKCSDLASDLAQSPKVVKGSPAVKVVAVENGEGVLRLFISNDATHYNTAVIEVRQGIQQVRVATRYPGMPVSPGHNTLSVRAPAGGMVILDVWTSE